MIKRFLQWLKSLFSFKHTARMTVDLSGKESQSENQEVGNLGVRPKINQASHNAKVRNVEKHLRIARACKNPHERGVHIQEAEKLIKRYGFPPLDRTPVY